MKGSMFLFALVFVIAAMMMPSAAYAASNTTCPNLAVSRSTDFQNVPFAYVESTKVNTVCPMLNNAPSCCPDNVITAVESAFNVARARVVLAKVEMDAIRQHSAVIDVEFQNLLDEINRKQASGEIDATTADALRTFVNSVKTALTNFIDRVTTSFIRCLESILTYLAGVVCFGCDVNWQNYTVYYSANNSIVVVVNQATCDAMNGGCIDFYLSFVQLVVDLRNAAVQLANDLNIAVTVPSWNNPCYNGTLYNDTQTNGARCKDFICQRLIHGADTEEPDASATRREANLNHDLETASHLLTTSFGHARAAVGDVYADRVLDRALLVLRAAHGAHASSMRVMRDTSNQGTTYSSGGGVDLYGLGTQSGLNKSAGAGMLTVATFLFGLIAAVAMIF